MITGATSHIEIQHDGPSSPVFAFLGDTVLLPASLKNARIVSPGRFDFLEITLPEPQKRIAD